MADVKITDYSELTTPEAADLLEIVDDPGGTPISKKVTVENLLLARPFIGFSLNRTADLSLTSGVVTNIPWSGADYDTGGFWDGGDPTLITIPITGYYALCHAVRFEATGAGGARITGMFFNGTTANEISEDAFAPQVSFPVLSQTSTEWHFTAGDTVEIYAYQDSGGGLLITSNQPVFPNFRGHLIAAG